MRDLRTWTCSFCSFRKRLSSNPIYTLVLRKKWHSWYVILSPSIPSAIFSLVQTVFLLGYWTPSVSGSSLSINKETVSASPDLSNCNNNLRLPPITWLPCPQGLWLSRVRHPTHLMWLSFLTLPCSKDSHVRRSEPVALTNWLVIKTTHNQLYSLKSKTNNTIKWSEYIY